jgi:Na+/melibiose symporter-like transporter
MFIHDAIEYGAYKSGHHNTGVSLSIQTFSNKIRSALVSSIPFAILALFAFEEGEPPIQPDSAVYGIWFTFTIIPAIGSFATLIFFSFYKLRDKAVQVMVQYNSGHITKEEADTKLEVKYGPAYAEYNEK